MSSRSPVGLTHAEELREPPRSDTHMRPAESRTNKPVDPNAPKCEACGGYHGGVNSEIACLRSAVRQLRDGLRLFDPNHPLVMWGQRR